MDLEYNARNWSGANWSGIVFQPWTPAVLACSSHPPSIVFKPPSGGDKKMRQAGAGLPLMVNMGCFTETHCEKKGWGATM